MPKKKRVSLKRFVLFASLAILAGIAGLLLSILTQLPDIDRLDSYTPSESTQLFSADGKVLARLHREENRRVVPLSKISPHLIKAVIATEDPRFYVHHGLDFYGIVRAGIKNVMYGRVVEGGSTITQQLARNLFLTRRRVITRKIAEAILAMQIERRYTKEEILEMYLNQAYLGHNSYGIESASNLYFNKPASELNLSESAVLAGMIRGPELYSPFRNFKRCKQRQLFVLNKLAAAGLITYRDVKLAAIGELELFPENLKRRGEIASYFISHVLKDLIKEYGEEMVYHGGLRVYTTLDSRMQTAAENVVTKYVTEEGQKYNFSQAALVSLDPRTGYIKALIGGVDFYASKFNRATQARRQPGSAFKPFVYTAAMEQRISPGTILMDEQTTFEVWPNEWNPEGTWDPKNFTKEFYGPVSVRYALEKSLNIPSIKLLERVGINSAIETARRMGIKSHLEPGLALTLGVSEVTLLELTSAYTPFANAGIRVEPTAVTRIENRDGVVLYKHTIQEKKAIDSNTAAVMVDLMSGVLKRGTGVRGRLARPAAAKTGTTENFKDAWFVGFVPQLTTGVWVGNDNNVSMEGVAEVAVCPRMWKSYNQIVLANEPVLSFPKPEGLIQVEICEASNKLPNDYCPFIARRIVTYWRDSVPREKCDFHEAGDEFGYLESLENENY
ncbi:transglycosylase domain-containing protein [Candidatus Margulisiibacteriota bacterium]